MQREQRRAAVAAYKERKVVAGLYVVRCAPTGQVWVGRTPALGTVENRLWFTLRHGGHAGKSLQAAWNTHGAGGLAVAELERLDDETLAYVRDATLKERLAHWTAELGAEPI